MRVIRPEWRTSCFSFVDKIDFRLTFSEFLAECLQYHITAKSTDFDLCFSSFLLFLKNTSHMMHMTSRYFGFEDFTPFSHHSLKGFVDTSYILYVYIYSAQMIGVRCREGILFTGLSGLNTTKPTLKYKVDHNLSVCIGAVHARTACGLVVKVLVIWEVSGHTGIRFCQHPNSSQVYREIIR